MEDSAGLQRFNKKYVKPDVLQISIQHGVRQMRGGNWKGYVVKHNCAN